MSAQTEETAKLKQQVRELTERIDKLEQQLKRAESVTEKIILRGGYYGPND